MPDSMVAALLRSAGVETRLSAREAARRCGLSPQTISKLLQGDSRRIRRSNLEKISNGLGINLDLLERASLADAGFVQAASDSSLAAALEHIQGLSPRDLATIQIEIGRMQQARAAEQEMRDTATSAE